jgi:hypothetical protein
MSDQTAKITGNIVRRLAPHLICAGASDAIEFYKKAFDDPPRRTRCRCRGRPRAIAAGARAKIPVQDMFWGDRYGTIQDLFGHNWSIATPCAPHLLLPKNWQKPPNALWPRTLRENDYG